MSDVRLAGRAEILDPIEGALRACSVDGLGAVARLVGDAGIGKTAIADHVASVGVDAGLRVWRASAAEGRSTTPFSVVGDIVSADGDALVPAESLETDGGMGPAGQVASTEAQRFAVIERTIEALEASAQRPMLLILDDLHWADGPSVDAIAAMVETAATHPVVVVLAHRPQPSIPVLDRTVAGAPTVIDIVVEPLDSDAVAEALRNWTGGAVSAEVVARSRIAGGNPFLLRETVDGLLSETPTGAVTARSGAAATTLAHAVIARLEQLDPDAATVVRAAAVQGPDIDVHDLARLLGRPAVALTTPLSAAIDVGLLEERGTTLHFRHDLVRESVYRSMPVAIRSATHRDLAALLAARNAPAAMVGSHLILGDRVNDPASIAQLQRAAAETGPVAPDTALDFLDRARTLVDDDLETRLVIERARLDALTAVGRLDEAEATAHWLVENADPDARGELLNRLGGIATIAGDSPQALAYLEAAYAAAPEGPDRPAILAMTAMAHATNFDYATAGAVAAQAIALGETLDETVGHSAALALMARMSTYDNTIDEGLRLGAAAVAIADRDPTGLAHQYIPCMHYGQTAFDADRLDVAEEMAARGTALAGTHQIIWTLPFYGTLAAAAHYRRGSLDSALAEAEAAIEIAERTTSRQTLAWARSVAALTAVATGEITSARTHLDAADAAWDSGQSSLGSDHLILARAMVAEAEGDSALALTTLRDAWELFDAIGLPFCHPLLASDIARLALDAGETSTIDMVIDATTTAARNSGLAAVQATRDWIRARHDADGAAAQRALSQLRTTPRRLEVGRWLWHGAELLGSVDGTADDHRRAAAAIFEECGALGDGAAVRRLLRTDPEPAVDVAGWGALTRTELDIAAALAEGCTNAEIAQRRGSSRRTVEAHLRSVYRKLGVEGRVKLTVAAAGHFGSDN